MSRSTLGEIIKEAVVSELGSSMDSGLFKVWSRAELKGYQGNVAIEGGVFTYNRGHGKLRSEQRARALGPVADEPSTVVDSHLASGSSMTPPRNSGASAEAGMPLALAHRGPTGDITARGKELHEMQRSLAKRAWELILRATPEWSPPGGMSRSEFINGAAATLALEAFGDDFNGLGTKTSDVRCRPSIRHVEAWLAAIGKKGTVVESKNKDISFLK
eukprot:5721587-Amphidinium_carterae.1